MVSYLYSVVMRAEMYLHTFQIHSVRNWDCDEWTGFTVEMLRAIIIYRSVLVFYALLRSTGWKESTLHHIIYASKLIEIWCILH